MGKKWGKFVVFESKIGAEGGTRTLMVSLPPDFESSASAISPLRQRYGITYSIFPFFQVRISTLKIEKDFLLENNVKQSYIKRYIK